MARRAPWRRLTVFVGEELPNPQGMPRADSFLGAQRDVRQFRDWHRRGVIEVRGRHPETRQIILIGPEDYAAVDADCMLTRADPGWTRFTRVEVRFAAPAALPAKTPGQRRRDLFAAVLQDDPKLTVREAVARILDRYPEAAPLFGDSGHDRSVFARMLRRDLASAAKPRHGEDSKSNCPPHFVRMRIGRR